MKIECFCRGKKESLSNIEFEKSQTDKIVACRKPYLMKVAFMSVFHPSTRFVFGCDKSAKQKHIIETINMSSFLNCLG